MYALTGESEKPSIFLFYFLPFLLVCFALPIILLYLLSSFFFSLPSFTMEMAKLSTQGCLSECFNAPSLLKIWLEVLNHFYEFISNGLLISFPLHSRACRVTSDHVERQRTQLKDALPWGMTYQLKNGILLACMIKCCKYICRYWKHTSLLCQWMSLVPWINEPKLWTWNPQLMSMLQILVTLFNAILESSWMLQWQAQCEHLYKLEQKSFFLQAVMSRLNVIRFLAERKFARPTHFLSLSLLNEFDIYVIEEKSSQREEVCIYVLIQKIAWEHT